VAMAAAGTSAERYASTRDCLALHRPHGEVRQSHTQQLRSHTTRRLRGRVDHRRRSNEYCTNDTGGARTTVARSWVLATFLGFPRVYRRRVAMGHDPGVVGLQFQRATRANGHLHHLARRRLVVDATEEVPFFVARATASQAVPEGVDDVMEKSVTDSGFAKKRVLVRKSTNQQLARATQRGSLRLRRKVGYETATLALRESARVRGHEAVDINRARPAPGQPPPHLQAIHM
jgi:hypothetical protein